MNFSSEYNWEGKVLLVAEDEDFNYIFLEEVLTDTNARLIRARDGEEAIRIFESNPEIDLVLMDMQMPVMNGYDATRNIKKLNQKIPVIAQTAYHYGEAYEEIMAAGCDDFVTKPIDINGLKDVIARFI
ncbi:response regulator [Marinifilum sp. D714]|uniref:response regulator n=1 Tax=Marinifilum sp. D714 TaxID=2937523 RepID=UPI0027BB48AB|nr:response regulator [Marinifilum sp. D714]MDQ2179683.1 response regulator [Marinifilum sp. D714]